MAGIGRALLTLVLLATSAIACQAATPGPTFTPLPQQSAAQAASVAPTESASPASPNPLDGAIVGGIDLDTAARIASVAESHPWTRDQLASGRSRLIEVVDSGDGKSGVEVIWVVYTPAIKAISVFVDRTTEAVVDYQQDNTMPDFSPAEQALAGDIALADPGVRALRDDWVVNNVTGGGGPECISGRCLAVFLVPRSGNYQAVTVALVDLAAETVVDLHEGA